MMTLVIGISLCMVAVNIYMFSQETLTGEQILGLQKVWTGAYDILEYQQIPSNSYLDIPC
jgi:hypothetical protein